MKRRIKRRGWRRRLRWRRRRIPKASGVNMPLKTNPIIE
jgi:hypothetical protein